MGKYLPFFSALLCISTLSLASSNLPLLVGCYLLVP